MTARHKKSGNSGEIIENLAFVVASVFNLVPRFAQIADTIGSVVGFRRWCREMGSSFYSTRIKLWQKVILPQLAEGNDSISVFEFGVAYGEASRWWLRNLPYKDLKYAGFDLFTGLPTAWRNLPAGAFNAEGKTPEINDERATWYVGDVGQTITEVDWTQHAGRRLFIFDLDLFSPSYAVWDVIEDELRNGDLLCFDEAFDTDERLLLKAFLLPTNQFDVLGASPFGMVLQHNGK
jgi:hypothetical protein